MLDIKKIQELIQMRPDFKAENLPKHIIINLPKPKPEENELKQKEVDKKRLENLKQLIQCQLEYNIPICTINIGKDHEIIEEKKLVELFEDYLPSITKEKKMRILVIGKWTKLKGYVVDAMKKLIIDTKDYNDFFLNICLNYDGQVEIVDACRLLLKKMYEKQEESDSVDIEKLKENIYSSYFLPADLIIEYGTSFTGTLMWDSKDATIYFLNKKTLDNTKSDFLKSLEHYRKVNN